MRPQPTSNAKLDRLLGNSPERHWRGPVLLRILLLPILIPVVCVIVSSRYLWSQWARRTVAGFCGSGSHSARPEDRDHANMEQEKKRAAELRNEAPKSLPTVRKRSLTLPLSQGRTGLWQRKQETADQLQSTLFGQIPLEVRELIYKHYLTPAERCVHIFRRTDQRLGHYLCTGEHDSHSHMPLRDWGYNHISSTRAWEKDEHQPPSASSSLLPLLKTCRRR